MDCSLPGSSAHRISQARIGSGLLFPSSGALPALGTELHLLQLLHWKADSLPLSHWVGPYSFILIHLFTQLRALLAEIYIVFFIYLFYFDTWDLSSLTRD